MLSVFSRAALLALLVGLAACGESSTSTTAPRQHLEASLQSDTTRYGGLPDTLRSAVRGFYEANGYELAWLAPDAPQPEAGTLLETLRAAEDRGLTYATYKTDALERRLSTAYAEDAEAPAQVAALDVLLTATFMRHALDLHTGRIDPEAVDPNWSSSRDSLDLVALQERALTGSLEEALRTLTPQHDGFRRLQEAAERYAQIAEAGGWPTIPGGDPLQAGDQSEHVAALRERLAATGDLAPTDTAGAPGRVFDEPLADALSRFQERHGLEGSGVLDDTTRQVLNVPVEARLRTLQYNLERWRWLPVQFSERYVIVNVPEFRLRAYAEGQLAEEMAVVVGQAYDDQATPIFADEMEYLIFNPYWNVPVGIATEEIVPKAEEDLAYLEENGYEIVDAYGPEAEVYEPTEENLARVADEELLLRQESGPQNALGHVKFMFPNEHAVYLHDTPAEHLFDRAERTFSHGCIRVERPEALAAYALRENTGWDSAEIETALEGADWERVDLEETIPVYILYWTAYVDEETGAVHFHEDIYDHDQALADALQAARAQPSPS